MIYWYYFVTGHLNHDNLRDVMPVMPVMSKIRLEMPSLNRCLTF